MPHLPVISDACDPAWYCLRSQPKREHIAAAHLRGVRGMEVYCPRLRFQKMTRRGPVWFTEALFPNYLFARFDFVSQQKLVTYAHGVAGIVNFGGTPAIVPEDALREIRAEIGDGEHVVTPREIRAGDDVVVATGIFQGLRTLVTQVLPGAERVRILLEFLGSCREVEVRAGELMLVQEHILAA